MNKGEFIEAFAKRNELTTAESGRMVNSFIDLIGERIKKGESVAITGFGTFSVIKRAARKGYNPKTGEALKIAASKAPKFSPGATLKRLVNPKRK